MNYQAYSKTERMIDYGYESLRMNNVCLLFSGVRQKTALLHVDPVIWIGVTEMTAIDGHIN